MLEAERYRSAMLVAKGELHELLCAEGWLKADRDLRVDAGAARHRERTDPAAEGDTASSIWMMAVGGSL